MQRRQIEMDSNNFTKNKVDFVLALKTSIKRFRTIRKIILLAWFVYVYQSNWSLELDCFIVEIMYEIKFVSV